MDFAFSRIDGVCMVSVDGKNIDGVKDYKITTSADGNTEIVIKLDFKGSITTFETSTS